MPILSAGYRRRTRFLPLLLLLPAVSGCASRGGTPTPQPFPTTEAPGREQPGHPDRPGAPDRPGMPERPPAPVGSVGSLTIRLDTGRVARVSVDEYVEGAVAAEAWVRGGSEPAFAERVFEVQALVARTYAVASLGRHRDEGFDLCSTTHCQIYRPLGASHRWHHAIQEAVRRTHGQLILYGGAPILALFHANCGGATSAAQDIWGGAARPYLTSVADPVCARDPASSWRVSLPRDALVRALDADPKTMVGGRLDHIDVLQADPSGRVELVSLAGARSPVVRGEELRVAIVRAFGPRSVQSPRFTVQRDGSTFTFAGTGNGHGAGLCQFGAAARLREGASPADVIRYYYPGTVIGRVRDET